VARRDYRFGDNLGTASVPIESLDATTRRNLYADLNRGYEQMLGVGQDALTVPRPPAGGLQTSPPSQGQTIRVRPQLSRPVGYGQGSLFGLTAAEDRYRLAREISQVDRDPREDAQPDRIDVFESIPAPEPVDLNEPIGRQQPSLGQEPETPQADLRRPSPAGQDVFLDMMRTLKRQRQPGAQPEPDQQTSEQVAATGKGVLVQSLAGKGRDAVNYYMRGGQNQLRNGQYYEAANMFRNAARQDANNPLPKVGAGLALFAAGEPNSAAEQIRDALQRFPAVMEARIASANMVPQSDLKRQMQELEKKMQRDDLQRDPKMLLLTTFMYRNTGQHAKARSFARKLRDLTDDKLMEGYADYILTGRRPSGRVAPQPAPAPQP
jgi:tetratricopeptide (TPR) repeat protein